MASAAPSPPSPLVTLPTVLHSHVASFLGARCAFGGLARCHSSLARGLCSGASLRAWFDGRRIPHAEAELLPPHMRSLVKQLSFHGDDRELPQRLCEHLPFDCPPPRPLLLTDKYPCVREVLFEDVCLSVGIVPFERIFTRSDDGGVWPLRALTIKAPLFLDFVAEEASRHTWLHRMLPLYASTLRVLEITLNTVGGGQRREDDSMMGGVVWAIASANLNSLETLKLEHDQVCELEEPQPEAAIEQLDARTTAEPPMLNFSRFSLAKQQLMARILSNSPMLTTLQLAFFHPMLIFPHHRSLSHLTSLHFLGLLTFDSLRLLAQLVIVRHLLLDFWVDPIELQERWHGELDTDVIVQAIAPDSEVTDQLIAAAPDTHVAPTFMSATQPDVSFYLFSALSRWTELRSLQVQSTVEDTNFCVVNFDNFTLLRPLTQLMRLQFSCYFRDAADEDGDGEHAGFVDLSAELDRLCDTIPSLADVIVNIERLEADVDSNEDEESAPALVSKCAPRQPQRLVSYSPAHRVTRKLKKLGLWDGHATPTSAVPFGSPLSRASAHCALLNLAPFLTAYPHLHALNLIWAQVATFEPLQLIAHSLVSLCLFFTHTPKTLALEDGAVVEVDPNIAALSCLCNLGWLIVHGSGEPSSCLSSAQLIQMGRVLDRLPKLRNWRLEHQPAMTPLVWHAWTRPSDGEHPIVRFEALHSFSLKDCVNLGGEGGRAIIDDLTRGFEASSEEEEEERVLPNLLDLNLSHIYTSDESDIAAPLLREACTRLREAEANTSRHLRVSPDSIDQLRPTAESAAGPAQTALPSGGGWVRDLTTEGVEPNPGPSKLAPSPSAAFSSGSDSGATADLAPLDASDVTVSSSLSSSLWTVLSALPLLQVLDCLSMRDATLLAATSRHALSLLCPSVDVSAATTAAASGGSSSGTLSRVILRNLRRDAIACVHIAAEVTTTAHSVESDEADNEEEKEYAATSPQFSCRRAADQWDHWQWIFARWSPTPQWGDPPVPPPTLTGELLDRTTAPLVLLGSTTEDVDLMAVAMATTWTAQHLRCFLHAFIGLRELTQQLHRDGARLDVSLWRHQYKLDRTEVEPDLRESCRAPLACIMPWPINGGAGDEARSQRQPPTSERRSTSNPIDEWTSVDYDETSPETAAAHAAQAAAAGQAYDLPLYYGAVDGVDTMCEYDVYRHKFQGEESSLAHLSSVSRGSPWPLASTEMSTDRTLYEQRVMAQRIFRILGVSTATSYWAAAMEYPGRRPIDSDEAEVLNLDYQFRRDGHREVVKDNYVYWEDWFHPPGKWTDYSDDRLPDSTLLAIADLLRDSLVISFGTGWCQPWPRLIIAPQAPGWIGGFIAGGCS